MLKVFCLFCMMIGVAMAQNEVMVEFLSFDMCQSPDHRFDEVSKECIYCAHGTKYNPGSVQCEGMLSWLGKCFGEDHYHAATKECMYCAEGYAFSEETRQCEAE